MHPRFNAYARDFINPPSVPAICYWYRVISVHCITVRWANAHFFEVQYLGAFVSSFKAPWPTQIATESPLNVENDGACPRCEI